MICARDSAGIMHLMGQGDLRGALLSCQLTDSSVIITCSAVRTTLYYTCSMYYFDNILNPEASNMYFNLNVNVSIKMNAENNSCAYNIYSRTLNRSSICYILYIIA